MRFFNPQKRGSGDSARQIAQYKGVVSYYRDLNGHASVITHLPAWRLGEVVEGGPVVAHSAAEDSCSFVSREQLLTPTRVRLSWRDSNAWPQTGRERRMRWLAEDPPTTRPSYENSPDLQVEDRAAIARLLHMDSAPACSHWADRNRHHPSQTYKSPAD